MNRLGKRQFRAFSAGTHPNGEVHPIALEVLKSYGFSTEGLASKDWKQVVQSEEKQVDFIIAIHDQGANEECPEIPGQPLTARWHVADPASRKGAPHEQRQAFCRVFHQLENRIRIMTCLRPESVEGLRAKQKAAQSRTGDIHA